MRSRRSIALMILLLLVAGNALAARVDMRIFAVAETGEGIPAWLHVNVQPGTGQVSITLNSIVGEDTQRSITNAIKAAVKEANKDFYSYDYKITIESGAEYVSGPSAGLPIALAVYGAITGKEVPKDVSGTGSIDEYGNVGPVGGIYPKAKAAAEVGIKIFLIPKGERHVRIPLPEEVEPGIVIPKEKNIDIVKIAKEEWNMSVYEVRNLHEAIDIVFKGVKPEENIEIREEPEVNFVPVPTKVKYSEKFKEIVEDLLQEFDALLETNCHLPEKYEPLYQTSESYRDRARVALKYGYYYTAGNYAFLGITLLSTVLDVCQHPSFLKPDSLTVQLYMEELRKRVQEIEMRAEKYTLTTLNYEWVGGARERILRARQVLDAQQPEEPLHLLRELKSVEYWLWTAEKMLNIADELNGGIEITNVERVARDAIILAEDLSVRVGSSSSRLELAKEAYNRGWYFAAFAEATLAKAEIISSEAHESKLSEMISRLIRETREYKGLWAELYRNHGLYYEQAARAYARAGKDEKKSGMQRTSLLMFEAAKDFSSFAETVGTVSIKVEKKSVEWSVPLLPLGVGLVAAALLILALALRGPKERVRLALRNLPPEKRKEIRDLYRDIRLLLRAKESLERLSKSDEHGVLKTEIKRLERRINQLRRRLEKAVAPSPPRRSSRRSRGRRR